MDIKNMIRESVRDNRFLLVCTALFVAATEILVGIIRCDLYCAEIGVLRFIGGIIFRIVALFVGMALTYFLGGILNHRFSGVIAAAASIVMFTFTALDVVRERDEIYSIFMVVALMSLSFYYANSCTDSLGHTVCCYAVTFILAAATVDNYCFFVVLLVTLLMFASSRDMIEKKSVMIVNYIGAVAAIIAIAFMAVDCMNVCLCAAFIEGTVIHPEVVMLTTETFRASEYFSRFVEAPSIYNLAKIFGYFGSFAGVAMSAVISLFVASALMKHLSCSRWEKKTTVVGAVMILVRCFAGFFENFTIIGNLNCGIPILSDGSHGYFIIGLLLGFMIASPETIDTMIEVFENPRAFFEEFESGYDEEEACDNE